MNKLILGTPKGSKHPVYIRVNRKITSNPGALCSKCIKKGCAWRQK